MILQKPILLDKLRNSVEKGTSNGECSQSYENLCRFMEAFRQWERANVDEFAEGHISLIKSQDVGSRIWNDKLRKAGSLMFKVADANQPGTITSREFSIFLKCLGMKGENVLKGYLQSLTKPMKRYWLKMNFW